MLAVMSVVVPAYNEARALRRLLPALAENADGRFEIYVVANGCTDESAQVAREFGGPVRVLETPVANKHRAMRLADEAAGPDAFPRFYVDADVEIGARDLALLAEALGGDGGGQDGDRGGGRDSDRGGSGGGGSGSGGLAEGGSDGGPRLLAVAPERRVPIAGCPWTVRWYYDVWQRLPVVRTGLFGRGVIGVSGPGHARLTALPELMGDDLAASLVFAAHERAVVRTATSVVHPPRTYRDLIARRTRVSTVGAQAAAQPELAASGAGARTSGADLAALLRRHPMLAPKIAWFAFVALRSRRASRAAVAAGDYRTWLRDESSRGGSEAASAAAPAAAPAPTAVKPGGTAR
jgi:hypothetical protein